VFGTRWVGERGLGPQKIAVIVLASLFLVEDVVH
jgi:hypothetical protein